MKITLSSFSHPTCRVQTVAFCTLLCTSALLVIIPHDSSAATNMTPLSSHTAARITQHERRAKQVTRPADHVVRAGGNETMTISARRVASRGANNVISKAIMAQFTPGTSVLKAIDRLPGVSFSATDPLGIDTWGSSFYVRGFFMDQLGVTLDGIPLNDQTYESNNGLNVVQASIPDDIERSVLSEGPGGVNVPSTSTLGGTLEFETSNPKDKMGSKISQGFGTYSSYRTYVRGDTGVLNSSGTKAFIAYSRSEEGKWMGGGKQFQQQVDAKIVQPVGRNSMIKAFFNWSDLQEWGYQDTSLAMIDTLGWRVPHLYPNYALASAYAMGTISLPTSDAIEANGDKPYLYDGGQAEVDYTGGLNMDLAITDYLHWKSTLYGTSQTGYYTFSDYSTPSAGTDAPFSEEVWQTRQERYGFTTGLNYRIAHHTIDTGVWLENNNQQADLFWYNEPLLGTGAPLKTVGPYDTYGPAFERGYGFNWHTNNFTYHLEDTWKPLRNVRLAAGFKSMLATTSGGANYNNPTYTDANALPNGSMTASSAFLPHAGASWYFLPHHELYFDLAENMRTYQVLPNGIGNSLWSVQDQATFNQLRHTVKPERDWVYAIGYRYTDRYVQASLAGYHDDASHRLQAATGGTITSPISSVAQTSVHINGVDVALTLTPLVGLTLYNSVSYNHSTYGGNIQAEEEVYHTKGKKVVNYPQFMYKSNLSYHWKGLESHFDVHYYSKRFFSYTNDTSVSGYWITSAGTRYNIGNYSFARNVTIDFNVYNLLNSKYISMMGQNGNPMSGDYQSLERGSPRQFFGTISTEF